MNNFQVSFSRFFSSLFLRLSEKYFPEASSSSDSYIDKILRLEKENNYGLYTEQPLYFAEYFLEIFVHLRSLFVVYLVYESMGSFLSS